MSTNASVTLNFQEVGDEEFAALGARVGAGERAIEGGTMVACGMGDKDGSELMAGSSPPMLGAGVTTTTTFCGAGVTTTFGGSVVSTTLSCSERGSRCGLGSMLGVAALPVDTLTTPLNFGWFSFACRLCLQRCCCLAEVKVVRSINSASHSIPTTTTTGGTRKRTILMPAACCLLPDNDEACSL